MGVSRSVVALWVVGAMGCGLRSDPLLPRDAVGSSEGGGNTDPNRLGSCNAPLDLPAVEAYVSGQLERGDGLSQGWCGRDGGPEDAYTFIPTVTEDVSILVDALATEFDAVIRVDRGPCATPESTLVCAAAGDGIHFLAEAGTEYTVTIESPSGASGAYAFDVVHTPPPLELCAPHPEVIQQISGGSFFWTNTFSRGQGVVDGFCGGPGRENMFPLNADYAGFMYVTVNGANGLSPVVSFRRGCGATTEVNCARDGDTGLPGVAELEVFIDAPGQYFVVVDQVDIDGGDYSLQINFD